MNAAIEQLKNMKPGDREKEIARRKAETKKAVAAMKKCKGSKRDVREVRKDGSRRQAKQYLNPTLTQQSNSLGLSVKEQMENYVRTGKFTNIRDPKKLIYGDFTKVGNYQEALNLVKKAQESFESLPSEA